MSGLDCSAIWLGEKKAEKTATIAVAMSKLQNELNYFNWHADCRKLPSWKHFFFQLYIYNLLPLRELQWIDTKKYINLNKLNTSQVNFGRTTNTEKKNTKIIQAYVESRFNSAHTALWMCCWFLYYIHSLNSLFFFTLLCCRSVLKDSKKKKWKIWKLTKTTTGP